MTANERPRLALPWQPLDLVFLVVTAVGVLVLVGLGAYRLPGMPERVPVHFDAAGRPDGWGSPGVFVLLVIGGAILSLGLLLLSRFPHTYNYPFAITAENASRQYRLARRLVLGLGAYTAGLFVMMFEGASRVAAGTASSLAPGLGAWLLPILLGVPLLSIGGYFFAASRS